MSHPEKNRRISSETPEGLINTITDAEWDLFGYEAMYAAQKNPGGTGHGAMFIGFTSSLRTHHERNRDQRPRLHGESFWAPRDDDQSPLYIIEKRLVAPPDIYIMGRDKESLETESTYVRDILFASGVCLIMVERTIVSIESDTELRKAERPASNGEAEEAMAVLEVAERTRWSPRA